MQLFGTYTTEFENDNLMLTNYVALCMTTRTIVHSTENTLDADEPTGDVVRESVQVECNGQYFEFECEQGDLTAQGQADFANLLDETVLPALARYQKEPA